MLDSIDIASPFDLHGDGFARCRAREDVHRANGRRELTPHKSRPGAKKRDLFSEQLLEVRFDAVLDETGVHTQLVFSVRMDLEEVDLEPVIRLIVLDNPALHNRLGRVGNVDDDP